MSKLRIAFCGPNVELNDKLMRHAKDLIENEVVEINVLPNPFPEVMETMRMDSLKDIDVDWITLLVNTYRRMLEIGAREDDLVFSASCGIDQLVVQATYLQDRMERSSSGLLIADATGQEAAPAEMAMINRTGAVLQVLLNQTEEEVAEYWDFVYAVLPVVIGVNKTPEAILMQYEDFLTSVPAFTGIGRLPDNETSAMDLLEKETAKWLERLKES